MTLTAEQAALRHAPAVLYALGEEIAAMQVLDRLNRLEQLAWLPATSTNRNIRIDLLGCGHIAGSLLGTIAEHKNNLERLGLRENHCGERQPKGTEVTVAACERI